jgi:hypothetical protein
MAKNPHAVAMGRLSRQTPSPKQIAASKANGQRGGHPSLFKKKTSKAPKPGATGEGGA